VKTRLVPANTAARQKSAPQGYFLRGVLVGRWTAVRPRILAVLLCWLVAWTGPAHAQGVTEYALKSVLLFKLPGFARLPDDGRERTVGICVLGESPFGDALDRLARLRSGASAVAIRNPATAAEAGDCDFIYVSRGESGSLDAILRRLSAYPAVTVSDIGGFASAGGMVEFALDRENATVSILINRRAARARRIEFDARLLSLATVVEP
jgi:hypothetical protein